MQNQISSCRISKKSDLIQVVNLGSQDYCGHFPSSRSEQVPKGVLSLSWSPSSGLLQLDQELDIAPMYSDNYGYRSGLNKEMVSHLKSKTIKLQNLTDIENGDLVLDIGSNDGTLLGNYPKSLRRVGIDPTYSKFKHYYDSDIEGYESFFSGEYYMEKVGGIKAKIITSISMFYDLPDPNKFVGDIKNILDERGIWLFEQSYLPMMLEANSYDTICHEHIEYYSLDVINSLLKNHDLKIIDVSLNKVNGGSIELIATHAQNNTFDEPPYVSFLLDQEKRLGLDTIEPYINFSHKIKDHRSDLKSLISEYNDRGKKIGALGASTKGNVLLQYCNLTEEEIFSIGEVNEEKFNKLTPGSLIPIIKQEDLLKQKPDVLMILPWHFRSTFIKTCENFVNSGGKLLFPFPGIEIYG